MIFGNCWLLLSTDRKFGYFYFVRKMSRKQSIYITTRRNHHSKINLYSHKVFTKLSQSSHWFGCKEQITQKSFISQQLFYEDKSNSPNLKRFVCNSPKIKVIRFAQSSWTVKQCQYWLVSQQPEHIPYQDKW